MKKVKQSSSGCYVFSPTGMTEYQLHFFSTFRHKLLNSTVSESEHYGCGLVLRKYCFYPIFLPIRIRNFHGPSQHDKVVDHFINSKEKFFGLYSKRLKNDFDSRTKNKVSFVIQAPAWIYAKKNRSKFNLPKSGSIFFLSHSTFWTDVETNYKKVIEFINCLPNDMQPVSICMYFVDIQKKYHLPYLQNSIPVYTAGHWENKYFIQNFFEIVKHFKFAIGNQFGSQFLYCTSIGIKSIIFDEFATIIVAENDPNTLSAIKNGHTFDQIRKVNAVFSDKSYHITEEQKQLADEELGIKDGISLFHLSALLYLSYLHWVFTNFRYIIRKFILKLVKLVKRVV